MSQRRFSLRFLLLIMVLTAIISHPYPASAGPESPAATILSTSTNRIVEFRIDGVDCNEVVNLNVSILAPWERPEGDVWVPVTPLVEDCRATLDISQEFGDFAVRFRLPDWEGGRTVDESSMWRWYETGGYFELTNGEAWSRSIKNGNNPTWLRPLQGQTFMFSGPISGTLSIWHTGEVSFEICESYPCECKSEGQTGELRKEEFQFAPPARYVSLCVPPDYLGGLYHLEMVGSRWEMLLPLISNN